MKYKPIIARLQQLDSMQQALQTLPLELRRLKLSGAKEAALQQVRSQLEQTRLWVSATEQALQVLSPEERLLMHRLFISPRYGSILDLCQELDMEQSTLYRHRQLALKKLSATLAPGESPGMCLETKRA